MSRPVSVLLEERDRELVDAGDLCRLKQNAIGLQIAPVVEVAEAAGLGAAILGGLGAGVYTDVSSALGALHYAQTLVEPVADQVVLYEAIFRQVYRQIYLTLRPLHHTIYQLQNTA